MTMQVVLATTVSSTGGTWRHIEDLAAELQQGGHEVVIGLADDAGPVRQAAESAGLRSARWTDTVLWRGWLWHAHLHDTYERRIAVAAGIRCWLGPTVLTEHLPRSNASDPSLMPGPRHPLAATAKTAFKRAEFSFADAVISVSPTSAAFLRSRYGIARGAIDVVPNGVPTPQGPSPTNTEQPVSIISTGSVIHQKGHELLVLAAARSDGSWHATVAGDGPLRRSLTELATASRVPVRFSGWIPGIERQLARHHISCLPSRWESCPYAALEASADQELRAAMGAAGRERAARFTVQRMATSTVEVYRSACGRRGVRDRVSEAPPAGAVAGADEQIGSAGVR